MDIEIMETCLINSVAPLRIIKGLILFLKAGSYIINISSSKSSTFHKNIDKHIHTNYTKAYIDMITYSAGKNLIKQGINIVSVDPGWLSYHITVLSSNRLNCRFLMECQESYIHYPIDLYGV